MEEIWKDVDGYAGKYQVFADVRTDIQSTHTHMAISGGTPVKHKSQERL